MEKEADSYGLLSILLHWSSVFFIVILVFTGFAMRFVDTSWQRSLMTYHLAAGVTLLLIHSSRIVLRLISDWPDYPQFLSDFRLKLYKINHFLLYLLIFGSIFTGIYLLISTNLLISIGEDPISTPKAAVVGSLGSVFHRAIVYSLLFTIIIHIIGVFLYHYFNKPIIQRMTF